MTLNPSNSIRELRKPIQGSQDSATSHLNGTLIIRGDIVAEANDFVRWDLSLKHMPPRNTTLLTRHSVPILAISK